MSKKIALAGDWHGNAGFAHAALKAAKEAGVAEIIHLGDFGIWPGKSGAAYLKAVDRSLVQLGMWLQFIDGNHDDHWQLAELPIVDGVRPVTERITHLPRGYRWDWHGTSWLALGGATSLDRRQRVLGRSWWPEEAITFEQAQAAVDGGRADYMITHDAPVKAIVPGLRDDIWDRHELAVANAHRELLQIVVDRVQPKRLWHGHMHVAYTGKMQLNGLDDECIVQGLASDSETVAENVTIFDLNKEGLE